MKTEYEYLKFVEVPVKTKTRKFNCCNKKSGTVLGEVKWNGSWRQYCYFDAVLAVYSAGCMDDISHFCKQLNKK